MAVILAMIGKVGERVIDLTTQEILAVIKSRRSLDGSNHPAIIYSLAFCVSPIHIWNTFFYFGQLRVKSEAVERLS